MTKTTDTPDLDTLRRLVRARMLELGGGVIPQTLSDAARDIGCSHVALLTFLDKNGGIGVEMALRIARYLRQPRATVLRLAGHADMAELLSEREPAASANPHVNEAAKVIERLPADQQAAAVDALRVVVRAFPKPTKPKKKTSV